MEDSGNWGLYLLFDLHMKRENQEIFHLFFGVHMGKEENKLLCHPF